MFSALSVPPLFQKRYRKPWFPEKELRIKCTQIHRDFFPTALISLVLCVTNINVCLFVSFLSPSRILEE